MDPAPAIPEPVSDAPAVAPSRLRRFFWPSWKQRKGMLRAEGWLLVLACYVLLAFAWLWPQDWRNTSTAYVLAAWVALIVRAVQFHLGLLVGAVALIAAFGKGRRLFLASLPVVLFTLGPPLWQAMPEDPPTPAPGTPGLRVMSVNLLMINERYDEVIARIRAERPDVLALQEYTGRWHRAMQKALASEYPHCRFETREDSFGAAVYSRTPFQDDGRSDPSLGTLASDSPQQRAVVKLGGADVAVYNVHVLPPRTLEYTAEHRLQVADLADALAKEKLPAVVAGDFNWTESMPQHALLRRLGWRDAHDVAGSGRGATWPMHSVFRILPGIRLDHVYLGPPLTCTAVRTVNIAGSDHRALVADVRLRQHP
jgi:endonuclease/exonuclease/phosphatase (EEP) superfamily protein YafD